MFGVEVLADEVSFFSAIAVSDQPILYIRLCDRVALVQRIPVHQSDLIPDPSNYASLFDTIDSQKYSF